MLISPTSSNKSSPIKEHFGVRRGCRLQHVIHAPTNKKLQRLGNSRKWCKLRGWNDLNNVEFQPFTKTNSEGMEMMFSPGALKVALDGVR
jgi:hypothetical protein